MTVKEMDILEAAYENHREDIARREADYTRELNEKLDQINAQARMTRELLKAVAGCHCENCNAILARFSTYPLPIGRKK